jgi:ribosomal protein S18 acetylase RimI-like enzyme
MAYSPYSVSLSPADPVDARGSSMSSLSSTTPSKFTIRAFTPADQDAAKWLVNEGLGERFGNVDESFNPDLDDIAAHYIARGHLFVVAEESGGLIGTGCLVIAADGTMGQMVRLSVRYDRRGQGVGRALVGYLLRMAQARGLRRVWMETNASWDSAIRLYERCGFRRYAQAGELVFLERAVLGENAPNT